MHHLINLRYIQTKGYSEYYRQIEVTIFLLKSFLRKVTEQFPNFILFPKAIEIKISTLLNLAPLCNCITVFI